MVEFDWNEYLLLAEKLISDSANEAELRTAICRTYYAVFHAGLNKIPEIDPQFVYAEQHKQVHDWYGKQSGAIFSDIKDLFRERKIADYEPNPKYPMNPYQDIADLRSKAEEYLLRGKDLIQQIKNLQ
ncbi:hypothetical protein K8I31_01400 [bacterium]|nr:hypothetical protein [bacterium]